MPTTDYRKYKYYNIKNKEKSISSNRIYKIEKIKRISLRERNQQKIKNPNTEKHYKGNKNQNEFID